jgi:hypothetical protein
VPAGKPVDDLDVDIIVNILSKLAPWR